MNMDIRPMSLKERSTLLIICYRSITSVCICIRVSGTKVRREFSAHSEHSRTISVCPDSRRDLVLSATEPI